MRSLHRERVGCAAFAFELGDGICEHGRWRESLCAACARECGAVCERTEKASATTRRLSERMNARCVRALAQKKGGYAQSERRCTQAAASAVCERVIVSALAHGVRAEMRVRALGWRF